MSTNDSNTSNKRRRIVLLFLAATMIVAAIGGWLLVRAVQEERRKHMWTLTVRPRDGRTIVVSYDVRKSEDDLKKQLRPVLDSLFEKEPTDQGNGSFTASWDYTAELPPQPLTGASGQQRTMSVTLRTSTKLREYHVRRSSSNPDMYAISYRSNEGWSDQAWGPKLEGLRDLAMTVIIDQSKRNYEIQTEATKAFK